MNSHVFPSVTPAGFSFVDVCLALLVASLAALLLVNAGQSNAIARMQALNRTNAVRLGTELAAWTRRGGHRDLGMPLADALGNPAAQAAPPDCHQPEPACDARNAAWHYLLTWRTRVQEAIAGARLVVCGDRPPEGAAADWTCDAAGVSLVLKIGTGGRHDGHRPSAVVDLGIAP